MAEPRVVIVTGASRGLGAAVARLLGEAGTAVTVTARSGEGLERTAARLEGAGGRALVLPGDLAAEGFAQEMVARTLERWGRVDGLVNNAGVVEPLGRSGEVAVEEWRRNLEVNLLAPFRLCRAALPALREAGGRIVNVSTGAAVDPIEGAGAYSVAKAGLHMLTRVLAGEEARVVSLSIMPGVVDTAMQELLRRQGPERLPPRSAGYFRDIADRLEPPEVPGRALAWAVLHAPAAWSGRLMSYRDEELAAPAAAAFGG